MSNLKEVKNVFRKDVKLKGSNNYHLWKYMVALAIKREKLQDILEGTVASSFGII